MYKSDKRYNLLLHAFFIVYSLIIIIPFALLVIISLSSENSLLVNGYSFFPDSYTIEAYRYLFASPQIYRAYANSILVTGVGVVLSLVVTTLLAYPLSMPDLPGRQIFNFLVFFTMLFSGGLVPSYIMWTRVFHITNTYWAYLIPNMITNGFTVMIMRTYLSTNIPAGIVESAKIDGAGQFRIMLRIVLPISLPIIATVGLMSGMAYWNDWTNGLYYVTEKNLNTVQVFLNNMLTNAQKLSEINTGAGLDVSNMPTTAVRMAVAVAGAIPLMCVFPFFQKYFIKGMTIGAVKG